MPKRNRGKKTAAGGGLFTRRPPPAPLPPDPSASPASHLGGVYTTAAPAGCVFLDLLVMIGTFKSPQSALRPTAPVAVPEILCSQFAHRISTAATRSAPLLCHRQRSQTSPLETSRGAFLLRCSTKRPPWKGGCHFASQNDWGILGSAV